MEKSDGCWLLCEKVAAALEHAVAAALRHATCVLMLIGSYRLPKLVEMGWKTVRIVGICRLSKAGDLR